MRIIIIIFFIIINQSIFAQNFYINSSLNFGFINNPALNDGKSHSTINSNPRPYKDVIKNNPSLSFGVGFGIDIPIMNKIYFGSEFNYIKYSTNFELKYNSIYFDGKYDYKYESNNIITPIYFKYNFYSLKNSIHFNLIIGLGVNFILNEKSTVSINIKEIIIDEFHKYTFEDVMKGRNKSFFSYFGLSIRLKYFSARITYIPKFLKTDESFFDNIFSVNSNFATSTIQYYF